MENDDKNEIAKLLQDNVADIKRCIGMLSKMKNEDMTKKDINMYTSILLIYSALDRVVGELQDSIDALEK